MSTPTDWNIHTSLQQNIEKSTFFHNLWGWGVETSTLWGWKLPPPTVDIDICKCGNFHPQVWTFPPPSVEVSTLRCGSVHTLGWQCGGHFHHISTPGVEMWWTFPPHFHTPSPNNVGFIFISVYIYCKVSQLSRYGAAPRLCIVYTNSCVSAICRSGKCLNFILSRLFVLWWGWPVNLMFKVGTCIPILL